MLSGSTAVNGNEAASLYCTVASAGTVIRGEARIVKSASDRSKKTLPTASILIRAFCVATSGMLSDSLPSLGVLSDNTCGKVAPPSVDSEIFTFFASTGATSVPATSHVIG